PRCCGASTTRPRTKRDRRPTRRRRGRRPTPTRTRRPMAPEGSAVRLDGKLAASELIERLRAEVARLPYVPRLTFVRVGDDPASASYVRSKERLAGRAGVASQSF